MTMAKTTFPHRMASNDVTLDGAQLGLYVVEADQKGRVEAYYPLGEELPFTEWTPGPIELFTDGVGQVRVRQK